MYLPPGNCDTSSNVGVGNVNVNVNPQQFRHSMMVPNRRQPQPPFMHPNPNQQPQRHSPFSAANQQKHHQRLHNGASTNGALDPTSKTRAAAAGGGGGGIPNGHPSSDMTGPQSQFSNDPTRGPHMKPAGPFNGEAMQQHPAQMMPQHPSQNQQNQTQQLPPPPHHSQNGPSVVDGHMPPFNSRKLSGMYATAVQEEYARQRNGYGFMGMNMNMGMNHHPNHRNMMAMRAAATAGGSGTGMPPSFVSGHHGPPGPTNRGMMNMNPNHHGMYPGPNYPPNAPHSHNMNSRFRQHPTMNNERFHHNVGGSSNNPMMMNHSRPPSHPQTDTFHPQDRRGGGSGPEMTGPSQTLFNQMEKQTMKNEQQIKDSMNENSSIKTSQGHDPNITTSQGNQDADMIVERRVSITEDFHISSGVIGENDSLNDSGMKSRIQTTGPAIEQRQESIISNSISPCSSITTQTEDKASNHKKRTQQASQSLLEPNIFNFEKKSSSRISPKTISSEKEFDAASILCSLSRIIPSAEDISYSTSLIEQSIQGSLKKRRLSDTNIATSSSSNSNNEEIGNASVTTDVKAESQTYPTKLAITRDCKELNSLHCFVRSELLELFIVKDPNTNNNQDSSNTNIVATVSNDDDESSDATPSTSNFKAAEPTPAVSGRVGLRCVHCARENQKGCNASMSMFYPRRLTDLYKMVCTWQRVHYAKCKHIPTTARDQYVALKKNDKTRGKTAYWVTSAKEIGLVDDEKYGGGVRFLN